MWLDPLLRGRKRRPIGRRLWRTPISGPRAIEGGEGEDESSAARADEEGAGEAEEAGTGSALAESHNMHLELFCSTYYYYLKYINVYDV